MKSPKQIRAIGHEMTRVRRTPANEEPSQRVFDLPNGDRLIVLPQYRGRPSGSKSKRPLAHWGYQYLALLRKNALHGPGTGRGPEYIDATGVPSYEKVLFDTEAKAIAAVKKYGRR